MSRKWIFGAALFATAAAVQFSMGQGTAGTLPAADPTLGKGKVICLDAYYNQESNGKGFHYHWDDTGNPGMSKLGDVWKQYGATLSKLDKAPTRAELDKCSVYMIVNPSLPTNSLVPGKPNYIQAADADVVEGWVKDGGVLLMFANDKTNCDYEHYNILGSRFGITFNGDRRNEVPNARDRTPGMFDVSKLAPNEPLFKDVKQIYMKEIMTLTVKDPAKPLLVVDNEQHTGKDNVIATAKVGKGFVFAVGDPWIYNEYIDVVSTPGLTLENRKAAMNLVKWVLPMSSAPMAK
jgi:unsaturated rhamnogalacturonyl hydrolase